MKNQTPKLTEAKKLRDTLKLNFDARNYFFTKIDESWLDWLSSNGFFDVLNKESQDSTQYSYTLPELDYLVKVAQVKPAKVVDLMLSIDETQNFNPEVVDRFLWICAHLPADQLSRITQKIRNEKWPQLMGGFNRWAFHYEKMFDSLGAAKAYDSILTLAEAVLAVRPKDDLYKSNRSKDAPFYFDDLTETHVFNQLLNMDDAYDEAAFELTLRTLGEVISLGGEKEDDVFETGEIFTLFDADFFTLGITIQHSYFPQEDVKNLAAVAKKWAEKLIGDSCTTPRARELYEAYIPHLPKSRTMWRFRLFVWSLCPQVFKTELKDAFFKLFDSEKNLYPIAGGAEYERALQKGFQALSEADRREYVKKALLYFSSEKMRPYGQDIFSSISAELTTEERTAAENLSGKPLNTEYTPLPSIVRGYAGAIIAQPPITQEEFSALSIENIIKSLKTEWTPEALRKADVGNKDMHRPVSAEGVSELMRIDFKKRPTEYLQNAPLFFDREELDPHYTYSFFRGLYEAYKAGVIPSDVDWAQVMQLFADIIASSKQDEFDYESRERTALDPWLSGWNSVHAAFADVVKDILGGDGKGVHIPFEQNRAVLLSAISYLLEYPDPKPEEHEDPRKDELTGREHYRTSDPFTNAINSVRGRAFQALVLFVEDDTGKKRKADGEDTLSNDIKVVYEGLLDRENTEAIMFMFGHYLPAFYFRSVAWIKDLLPKIFPIEKHDLFLAAWEGYLTTNLFEEFFALLQPQYEYTVSLASEEYTARPYFSDLDDALASHVALAYMHYENFRFDSKLFREFWEIKSAKRHRSLVSFVGRHAISRTDAKEWGSEHGIRFDKLPTLWEWILDHCDEPTVFAEFGFWVSTESGIFEPEWLATQTRLTLEKSKGVLDWEYGLLGSLPTFTKIAPKDAIAILELFLIPLNTSVQRRGWIHIDDKLVSVFRELYHGSDTEVKRRTGDLIDKLVLRGSQFWILKDARNKY